MICKWKSIYLGNKKAKQTFANLTKIGCICEGLFRICTSWAKSPRGFAQQAGTSPNSGFEKTKPSQSPRLLPATGMDIYRNQNDRRNKKRNTSLRKTTRYKNIICS